MSGTAVSESKREQQPEGSVGANATRPKSNAVGGQSTEAERKISEDEEPRPFSRAATSRGKRSESRSRASSPGKRSTSSRGKSSGRRDEKGSDVDGDVPRPRSRMEYLGFEEYDGGKLSQVGRQLPAKMLPIKPTQAEPKASSTDETTLVQQTISSPDYFNRPITAHQYKTSNYLSHDLDGSSYTPSIMSQDKATNRANAVSGRGYESRAINGTATSQGIKLSKSMQTLPRVQKGDGDSIGETTHKYSFRYADGAFRKARARPCKHDDNVRIAVEGTRYFFPEKRDAYVKFEDVESRKPFRPRHTPARDFPPPGSDVWRHGAKDFIVNETHQADASQQSNPSHEFRSLSRSKSIPLQLNGLSAAFASRPTPNGRQPKEPHPGYKTKFDQGTTTRNTYTDFGLLSEDYRPRAVRPWTSIRTGVEGEFYGTALSKEHYHSRPISPRIVPNINLGSIKTAPPEDKFVASTTYHRNIENQEVCTSPRKRTPRYDPTLRLPDQLSWM